jgi:hypothetical protein
MRGRVPEQPTVLGQWLYSCRCDIETLRGGFMYAGNFITANNGLAFIRTPRLSPALVDRYDDASLRGLFANLLDQIDTTLERLSC